jgi:tetratricopeptide (TPR) repeat protein
VWATWIEQNSASLTTAEESKLQAELDLALKDAFNKAAQLKSSNDNFYHLLGYAAVKMLNSRYEEAIHIYNDVIEQCGQFSAFAYYERAYCYVQLLCNSYRHSGNGEKLVEYKQLAIDDLLRAKERLVAYKEELWVTQSVCLCLKVH